MSVTGIDALVHAVAASKRRARDAGHWERTRRVAQTPPPGDWQTWLVMAGRGFGKTRTGAEWIREQVMEHGRRRVALVGPTAADVRDVMVEGESGLIAVCRRYGWMARYKSSLRRVDFPNGAKAFLYSADEPDRLRGPQHDCFIAGTLIRTPTDEKPIETLQIGDIVLTRGGVRVVTDARSKVADVGTVTFSNGVTLTGTTQHPVLSWHGWTMLGKLCVGDVVCAGGKPQTDILRPTPTEKRSISIAGFGSKQTDQSRTAGRFITGIKTLRTIVSTIWTSRHRNSIRRYTAPLIGWLRSIAPTAGLTLSGANAETGATCVALVASGNVPKRTDEHLGHARFVARHLRAERDSSVVSVVSTWADAGRQIVYNLTVDHDPEYIANGIVVHNCSWSDEIGAWRYGIDAWDMLQFGLRLGDHPQQIATSTPKPVSLVRRLMREATEPGSTTIVTRGSTYENRDNLAASFLTAIEARYANTRIGRQEIDGELLEDVEGALWSLAQLEACRVTALPPRTKLRRIVVAVDPPASSDGAECGIIAAGLGDDGRGYVLADRSHRGSPAQWASTVVQTFDTWQANEVIAETNQGGEMVTRTLRTERASLPIRTVHASRGKLTRAEPVSALYEQGRISHIGAFPVLEDQMATWVPGEESPDRMDALVWAFTDLLVGKPVPKSAAVAMPHTSTWS